MSLDLKRALGTLEENERAAILLCDAAGLSHGEAAAALGAPLGAVKSQIARAREKMRAALDGNYRKPPMSSIIRTKEHSMPSDPVERLLSDDFAAERNELERDGFSERILHSLSQKRQARLAIIGGMGAIGAAIAGAQFMRIEDLFAPVSPLIAELSGHEGVAGISGSSATQILAAAAIAAAFAATALVLQAEQ